MTRFTFNKKGRSTIESLTPRFLRADEQTFDNAVAESIEAIVLRAILDLTPDDTGIHNKPRRLEKFKAILILLTHQFFFYQQIWQEKYISFFGGFLNKEMEALEQNLCAHGGLLGARTFKKILLGLHDAEINYSKNNKRLYLEDESLLPRAEFLTMCADKQNAYNVNIGERKPEIIKEIRRQIFINQVTHAGRYFNLFSRENAIENLIGLPVHDIYAERVNTVFYGIGHNVLQKFVDLQKKYVAYYQQYFTLVANTREFIHTLIHNMSADEFAKSYQGAMYSLQYKLGNASKAFLVELHTQQIRKPQFQAELNKLLHDVYLKETPFSIKDIVKETTETLSVHEIVANAHTKLHPRIVHRNTDITHTSFHIARIFDELSPQSTHKKVILFPNPELIPGKIHAWQLASLAMKSLAYAEHHQTFSSIHKPELENKKPLSKEQQKQLQQLRRQNAVDTFKEKLSLAKSVEEVEALILAAEKAINLPRNTMYFSPTTTTWLDALTDARKKALTLLTQQTHTQNTYRFWYNRDLFAYPLNMMEQVLGSTTAQMEIQQLAIMPACS